MHLTLSPSEINGLADQLLPALLARLDAATKQGVKQASPDLQQLTVADAAAQLKFSEKTILKYINQGKLRAKNFGTVAKPVWRVSAASVKQLLEHC